MRNSFPHPGSNRRIQSTCRGEILADNSGYSAADYSLLYTERQQAKRATAEDLLSVAPRIAERIISGGWISVKGSNGGVPSEANHVANGLWMTNLRAWSLRLSALLTC